jgi:hypothetical protein
LVTMQAPGKNVYDESVGEAALDKARVALARTGLNTQTAQTNTKKAGFLLKRGPLKVCPGHKPTQRSG